MIYNILAVGDVVGACGVKHLSRCLRSLKKRKSIHFTVVNGENAAMVGLTPNDADDIFAAGADVITLGNHTFGKMQIRGYLDDCPYILRPANLGSRVPGRGYAVYDCGAARIAAETLKFLRGYRGAYCVESFDPRAVLFLRKNAPDVIRGQLASGNPDDQASMGAPTYWLLKNLLVNVAGRPHFIAYSAAPTVVCIVPLVGPLVGSIWFGVCCFIGCKYSMRLPWSRTGLALGPLYLIAFAIGMQLIRQFLSMSA